MDEYIRQLSHNGQEFDDNWPQIYDNINRQWANTPENEQLTVKMKCLNAIVDYILVDNEQFTDIKAIFIEHILKIFKDEPKLDLDFLMDIFFRIFDVLNINNLLQFTFIKKFYIHFHLGEQLSIIPSIELIDKLLHSFEKYQFLTKDFQGKNESIWNDFISGIIFSPLSSDRNKLTHENIMMQMQSQYQRFYRWTIRYEKQSEICSHIQLNLERRYPNIFDNFKDLDDILFNLKTSVEPPISQSFIRYMIKYYDQHIDIFQKHITNIYFALERLIVQNEIEKAIIFTRDLIERHFNSIINIEELIQKLIYLCSIISIENRHIFCEKILLPISKLINRKKWNKKYAEIFFDFILTIIDLKVLSAPECVSNILDISEFYPWKQLTSKITHLVRSCIDYDQLSSNSSNNGLDNLEKIFNLLVQRAKQFDNIKQAIHDIALQAILKWSSIINQQTGQFYGLHVFRMGRELTELIDLKKVNMDICIQLVDILQKRIDRNDESYELNDQDDYFLNRIANLLALSIEQLKILSISFHEKLGTYFYSAFNCTFRTESGIMSFAHMTSLYLWYKIIYCFQQDDDIRPYELCLNRLHDLIVNEDEQDLNQWWITFWSLVAPKFPNIAINYLSQFLDDLIDRKQFILVSFLPTLYSKQPELFHTRLDDIIQIAFSNQGEYLVSIIFLLNIISKTHPEIFTSNHIDLILNFMKTYPNITNGKQLVYQTLLPIANAQPELFVKYQNEFLERIKIEQDLDLFRCFQTYSIALIILQGEIKANEYLNILIDLLKTIRNISNDLITQIFHTCQLIGLRNKQLLASKRNDFISYESNTTCRMLIDLIDGNKLTEENQIAMNRTMEEVTQIEQRIVRNERDIQNVTKIIKRQELNITNLDKRVDNVENDLNNLNEQVQIHSQEIERIDAKTLSYVPSIWGRDVCTLLNIRADNDWRLLGKRFGYSSSELKHWAMQNDPSMSLLNEWFMTHKADEATYGLVKMLNDIGRNDVEQIIRKAVIATGDLIPDDLPMVIKRLPPIFLSYQWGSQSAVLKLKSNLEQAGYACWMDIGQMGGGDKLYAQIDAGIRGAKVVICCMNKTYPQSDNCSREVHLTISTGKPLIPLQMEKQTWPPEGALGPIMSEYLYVRFYDKKNNDPDVWPEDRFIELLGQIRYYVAPDPDMITDKYHNWFVPRSDNLIFIQSKENQKQTTIPDDTPLVVTYPQIMISYQWDYQKDIVQLYEKLTKLGYRCWLDIFQMGGGDSLFEKIDTGIRNAKCIISCVTPKYTKSINCRREMALSDALKKPILPLLLEQTSTWPPSGPMAMVFAEKTYIDFRRINDQQERWFGKEFDLLLVQLKQLIPEVQTTSSQRHLLDMQRPTTAIRHEQSKLKRIGSAPVISKSRACSMM